MLPDLLFVPVLALYVAVLIALFAFGVNFLILTTVALRSGSRRPASTIPETWPVVTVQLPVFNEFYVAARLIDAVAALDYPRDRLEIQVLDDSTDDTSEIIEAAVARWAAEGLAIRRVTRDDRRGYKAGALGHGLESAHGDLIAIFDADFLPQRDFLRSLVPALVADPGMAFVQARWGHVNRDSSLLTRLQALAIDGHFAIEQSARWASGSWFNFNGTAGIWRRQAMLDAGGWQDDTLTEDLDLSYRAFLAGWHAGFVNVVEAPAELPVSYSAYRRQQHRWARGSFECAVKHLPAVWAAPVPLRRKLAATLHLTGYGIHLCMLALALLYPLILVVSEQHHDLLRLLGTLSIFNLTAFAPAVLFTLAQRRLRRPVLRQIPSVLVLSVFGAGLMVNTARAAVQLLRPGRGVFERTPKFAVRERHEHWERLRYQIGPDRIVLFELAVALINTATCVIAVTQGVWAIAVYTGIFTAGLMSSVGVTLAQAMRTPAQRGA